MQLLKTDRKKIYTTDFTETEATKSYNSFSNIVMLILVSYLGLFVSTLFIILMAWLGGIPIYV